MKFVEEDDVNDVCHLITKADLPHLKGLFLFNYYLVILYISKLVYNNLVYVLFYLKKS